MKATNKLYAALVAVVVGLNGCGGGGGGGSDESPPAASATATASVTPAPTPPPCPTGEAQIAGKVCPAVNATPVTLTTVAPRAFKQGVTIQLNGTLDPNSVTNDNVALWKGVAGTGNVPLTAVAGTVSVVSGNKDMKYVPTQLLANGQAYTLFVNVKDSLGRPVQMTISFTTNAMVCADNAIWSNPAAFSAVYQDCVADIGVQTLVNASFNTLQDSSCVITVGTPLSAECKAYMTNGTMILAKTSVVVNGHAAIWMAYIGTDKVSTLVLLDESTLAPVGKMALPNSLVWIIGNPTGASVSMSTASPGVFKNGQMVWNQSTSTLGFTCFKNC
ncbi:MAG: hypothetical protein Q7R90_00105 [bacterium]|nr:hypothetical protein [bacterium]